MYIVAYLCEEVNDFNIKNNKLTEFFKFDFREKG